MGELTISVNLFALAVSLALSQILYMAFVCIFPQSRMATESMALELLVYAFLFWRAQGGEWVAMV